MMLGKNDVEHVASLCNLSLSAKEVKKLQKILSDTLDYIKILEELDTRDVAETYQVTGLVNVYKDDDVRNSLDRTKALQNSKKVVDNKIATEAVFDRE